LPSYPQRAIRKRRQVEQIIAAEAKLMQQGHIRLNNLMRKAIGQGWRPKKRGGKTA
jgi:hypothetical protein